jgi:hypothetical protein
MNDILSDLALLASLLGGFPLFWVFLMYLASTLGGWGALAAQYTAPNLEGDVPLAQWRWQTMGMRWANYNGVATITLYEEGIHFAVPLLFRPGHPPFLLPWEEMQLRRKKMLFQKYVQVRGERAPSIVVELPQALADKIETAVGKRWAQRYNEEP